MPDEVVPDVCKTCLANMKGYDHCDYNGTDCIRLNQAEWLNAHGVKFASMGDMKRFVNRERRQVKEWLCPNCDMEHPTMYDLNECENGAYCDNHWGCHTFRHIFGSREIATNVQEKCKKEVV